MNAATINKLNEKHLCPNQKFDWLESSRKIWGNRKLLLKVCCIGAIIGIIIAFGTPREYTATIYIVPEGYGKSSSSGMEMLAAMTGFNSKPSDGRDAIYPSLYPAIVHSTPFLISLFDVKVHEQKDSTPLTLAQYLKERQKTPWWNAVTSVPSKLIGWTISQLTDKPEASKTKIDPFQMTREEAGIAGAIASKIKVGVDKEKRTITLFVTMQDPLVAATVADTVRVRLQEYITEYRTVKARNILKYNETLCDKAQAEYHSAQEKYTQYADANRNLTMMIPRARLSRLQSNMDLALSAYNQRKKQVEAAQARVEKEAPVYTVIQPVVLPLSPSSPRKMLILVGCIFLSAAGGIGWVLYMKDFIQKIRKKGIAFRQHVNQ